MRVLLVGGAGFIGAPVARRLAARGQTVALLHTGDHEPPLPREIVHLHNKNVRPHIKDFPREAIDFAPDVVVHFLLLDDGDARACVAAFAAVARRLVMLSSGDVYRAYGQLLGHEPPGDVQPLLDEDAPLRQTLYRTHQEIPVGEAQGRWRWTHGFVDDVAEAVVLAALDERAVGSCIYNIGEAETPTQRQRVEAIARVLGWRGRIVDVPDGALPPSLRDPHPGVPDLAYDTSRVRRELGFAEGTSYDEALARTIALY